METDVTAVFNTKLRMMPTCIQCWFHKHCDEGVPGLFQRNTDAQGIFRLLIIYICIHTVHFRKSFQIFSRTAKQKKLNYHMTHSTSRCNVLVEFPK